MRSMKINQDWYFGKGLIGIGEKMKGEFGTLVQLPHDYMIAEDVCADAVSQNASGYYQTGVAHYFREIDIPAEWAGERIFLRTDGIMMNATVEVNGSKAALQHYGYAPFETDITALVYPGQKNRIVINIHAGTAPNSRWYSGAGLFRGIELVHTPALHVAFNGLSGSTRKIEYAADGTPETAYLQVSAEIRNDRAENRLAEVTFSLVREDSGESVIRSRTLTEIAPLSCGTAYMTLTVDRPQLWSAEEPNLYRLQATVRDKGTYKTHIIPEEQPAEDTESVLFGIRTVEADVKHGLRINGKTVKLRGGCLHHDNGVIGAVSVYDAEARKVRILQEVGFNAIRTTHNPPSAALIEACDRLGMYVFDEAFDAWGMGKQPGDYNLFFEADWEKDLSAFIRRDRCHPSVIIWSTGNEITERAGLGDGYILAVRLAETVRKLDPSRPISNGICSFWNGLDDALMEENMRKWAESLKSGLQNADLGGKKDRMWEEYTEAFANGLDIVGYNYLENKYEQDHELFPERVILGSENYPKEVGLHWPMIEETPWILGEFTWTAWDYIGEAGIGKACFFDRNDPNIPSGQTYLLMGSSFPWRTANDADIDITGRILPQGIYRRIVFGSRETGVFSYDPDITDKVEILSNWGFPGVQACWNWPGREEKPVKIAVFSAAREVELLINGESIGRQQAGEALVHGMPRTFLFTGTYRPGTVEAVSYENGQEVSRAVLKTAGAPAAIRLVPETDRLYAGPESLAYIRVEITDADGNTVPDANNALTAGVSGQGALLGFGSGNPMTDENYTSGRFAAYRGGALAVLRAGNEKGSVKLSVSAEGLAPAEITLSVE